MMNRDEVKSFIAEVKVKASKFLDEMHNGNGGYAYTYSGDLVSGMLGPATFACKIAYTINRDLENKEKIAELINSFQKEEGYYIDKGIKRRTVWARMCAGIRSRRLTNMSYNKISRAETRQAISSLSLIGKNPAYKVGGIPSTPKEVEKYMSELDWTKPWDAGSHVSHLVFFASRTKNASEILEVVRGVLDNLRQSDGFWYRGKVSDSNKINGAMKIVTALKIMEQHKINVKNATEWKKVVDLCLRVANTETACHNFNILYVICFAGRNSKKYRNSEIEKFVLNRVEIYKKYYHEAQGGFSFYENRSNDVYYGAKIALTKNEPDIHGTAMFVWGLAVVANYFEFTQEYLLKEYIP